jgi:flagellar biosynthesis chaperone FliJ
MMEKKQGLQVRALTRQEQKQTDEFASQQFARANARQQEGWA